MTILNDLLAENEELQNNKQIVSQLNKLFQIDPELTKKLVNTRNAVSKAYTEAEEFMYLQDEDPPVAGLVGVLNGLVLDTNKYRLAANYDNDELTGFILLANIDGKFVIV